MTSESKQTEQQDLQLNVNNDEDYDLGIKRLNFSPNPKNPRKRKHVDLDNDPFADQPSKKKRKIIFNDDNNKENEPNTNNNNNCTSHSLTHEQKDKETIKPLLNAPKLTNNNSTNSQIFTNNFKIKFSVLESVPIKTINGILSGIRRDVIKIIPYTNKYYNNEDELIQIYIGSLKDIICCQRNNSDMVSFKFQQKRISDNEASIKNKQIRLQKEKQRKAMELKQKKIEQKTSALLNSAWSKILNRKPKKLKCFMINNDNKVKINDTTGIYELDITLTINCNIRKSISNISLSLIFSLLSDPGGKEIRDLITANQKLINTFEDNQNNSNKYTLPNVLDVCCRYYYNNNNININESKYKLKVKLYPYQIQSIQWMIDEENDKIGFHRHFYKKYTFNNSSYFYYSPTLKHLIMNGSLPVSHGGFLCEEMGLGKTIESLAVINYDKIKFLNRKNEYSTSNKLILSFKKNVKIKKMNQWGIEHEIEREYKYYKSLATLIIAPVSLVGQWEKECKDKSKIKLKLKRYYGSRKRDIKLYINQDIIFTTYGTIAKEDGSDRNRHILHNIHWHRIILDESHYIKNGFNESSQCINNLKAVNKWNLTGTPFGRRIDDILNQLNFIGFDKKMLNKMKDNSTNKWNFVIKIIKAICMRHKKDQLFNNKEIVKMTKKEENVIYVEFTSKQREFYNKLYLTAKERYLSYKETDNIGRGLISILSSLFPARQACSGCIYSKYEIQNELDNAQKRTLSIKQIVSNKENRNKTRIELYNLAKEFAFNNDDNECPICFETPIDEPLQTSCRHVFCGECIKGILVHKPECPLCRKLCIISDLKRPPSSFVNNNDADILKDNNDICVDNIKFDAKLRVLISELNKLKRSSPSDKVLIFTSFSKSLNWMCSELEKNGFKYKTLTGSMSMNKRKKELFEFINNKNIKIFILTVRSGAVGITLNAANHIFMMEPPFNNSLYKQAINRVHRLGQKKKVYINTLIMKNSIEEKIWNINKQKESNNNNNNDDLCGNISGDKHVKFKQHEVSKLFE